MSLSQLVCRYHSVDNHCMMRCNETEVRFDRKAASGLSMESPAVAA